MVDARHLGGDAGSFPAAMAASPRRVYEGGNEGDGDLLLVEPVRGSCPDMCPAHERDARERDGALDSFERVDGDRNRTSTNLALKKYTRTPQRSAEFIRPLPILEQSMAYMRSLLDRPYDDGELLSLHSFLWDRMRAVRMDLRMQHLFGLEAIAMHEQMIRFHILAMHELCEYPTAEGFDAHLNIEQMNKASVDLFEMYDDHRNRGEPVATESEFRGYYALLKIDQHPGFNVEPAELARDLSRMAPEMRSSPDVVFAREVARATRSGNYAAFFRLAQKATYLQACLMHAHFTKVRVEALAALSGGLGPMQVIPIRDIASTLAIEEENVEKLLEYQGQQVKFSSEDGPHIVKERRAAAKPQPISRSSLVKSKRSQRVVADVLATRRPLLSLVSVNHSNALPSRSAAPLGETWLPRASTISSQRPSLPAVRMVESAPHVASWQLQSTSLLSPVTAPMQRGLGAIVDKEENFDKQAKKTGQARKGNDIEQQKELERQKEKGKEMFVNEEAGRDRARENEIRQLEREKGKERDAKRKQEKEEEAKKRQAAAAEVAATAERAVQRERVEKALAEAEVKRRSQEAARLRHKAEAEAGKLRTVIRKWRKLVIRRPPPLAAWQLEEQAKRTALQQDQRKKAMWMPLDVPAVVGPTLQAGSPGTLCLCWKLLICSRRLDSTSTQQRMDDHNTMQLSRWLCAKVKSVGASEESGKDVSRTLPRVATLANFAVPMMESHNGGEEESNQLWYVAKEVGFEDTAAATPSAAHGAAAILFVVDAGKPLAEERQRLHAVVNCIASGSKAALLIFAPKTCKVERLDSVNKALVTDIGTGNDVDFFPPPENGSVLDTNFDFHQGRQEGARLESETLRGQRSNDDSDIVKLLGRELQLEALDRQRIGAHKLTVVTVSYQVASLGRGTAGATLSSCLDDSILIDGLRWLAENSPHQPNLRSLERRDLILERFHLALQQVAAADPRNVPVETVVDLHNSAVRQAQKDVQLALAKCTTNWPPPEMPPNKAVQRLLPLRDSFSEGGVKEAVDSFSRLLLPPFCFAHGPGEVIDQPFTSLREQGTALRRSLGDYLRSLHPPAPDWVVQEEVKNLLENSCSVVWTGRERKLVPMWARVFEGLIHMRLSHVLNDQQRPVYILQGKAGKGELERRGSSTFIAAFDPIPLSQLLAAEADEELRTHNLPRSSQRETVWGNTESAAEHGECAAARSREATASAPLECTSTAGHEIHLTAGKRKSGTTIVGFERPYKLAKSEPIAMAPKRRPIIFQRSKESHRVSQMVEKVKAMLRRVQAEVEADPDVYAQLDVDRRRPVREVLDSVRRKA